MEFMSQITHMLLGLQLSELTLLVEESAAGIPCRQLSLTLLYRREWKLPTRFDSSQISREPSEKGISVGLPGIERNLSLAMERCAIWWPVPMAERRNRLMPEGVGAKAGTERGRQPKRKRQAYVGTCNDMCVEPGGLRGRLSVLPDRPARD